LHLSPKTMNIFLSSVLCVKVDTYFIPFSRKVYLQIRSSF
jgi:hypothetical protein